MAISYIGVGAVESDTIAIPEGYVVGDLLLMFAFRSTTTTAPTIPVGWTTVGLNTGTTCSSSLAYKVATSSSETSGTWANATNMICQVYRGQAKTNPVVNSGAEAGAGTTVTYAGIVSMLSPSSSWVVRFGAITSINTALEIPPSGHKLRIDTVESTAEIVGFDTNGPVATSTYASVVVGGTSGNFLTKTLELRADASGSFFFAT